METGQKIIDLPMGPLRPPADDTVITVGYGVRDRIKRNFRHKAKNGRMINPYGYILVSAFLLFCVAPLTAIYLLSIFAGEPVAEALLAQIGLPAESKSGSVPASGSQESPNFIPAFIAVSVLTYLFLELFVRECVRWFLRKLSNPNSALKQEFDKDNARQWAEFAAKAMRHCAKKRVAGKIERFSGETHIPFLVLKKFLPVPIYEFRRPEKYLENGELASRRERRNRKQRLFELDSLAGGVHYLLGAEPKSRFEDSDTGHPEKVVHDLYWRPDVQEMHDADQPDIFLRFHQSAIERKYTNTCFYKTFSTLNNFRNTPILILAVKDIVECLVDKNGEYKEDHQEIYSELNNVTPDTVLQLLQDNVFVRFPPRVERVLAQDYAAVTGPILFKGKNNDWIMQYDPARVWVTQEEDQAHIEAIVALRLAVHLASRTKTIGVDLKKRDLLVVDNRRALIARQEDRAVPTLADTIAGFYPSLAGRWLRKIYGFPMTGAKDNFVPDDVEEKLRDHAPHIAVRAALPSRLREAPCGDVLFDFGPDPGNWPAPRHEHCETGI